MRVPGFMKTPFAFSGDKAAIPEATQPGGQVSFNQGWGADYQKDLLTDPTAKAIDRAQTNQLLYIITTLLNRWQSEAFPEWIDSAANGGAPYPYPIGTIVRVQNGSSWVLRMSMQDANTNIPSVSGSTPAWSDVLGALGAAVLRNEATLQTMAGPLSVGAGSLLGGATPPMNANDKRLASLEWVTSGKSTQAGTPDGRPQVGWINRVTLPAWFSSDGTKKYIRAWGIASIPYAGVVSGVHVYSTTGIPVSPGASIATEVLSMIASHNHDFSASTPTLGISCRMPDARNLSITATSNQNIGPAIFVSWSVDYWAS